MLFGTLSNRKGQQSNNTHKEKRASDVIELRYQGFIFKHSIHPFNNTTSFK